MPDNLAVAGVGGYCEWFGNAGFHHRTDSTHRQTRQQIMTTTTKTKTTIHSNCSRISKLLRPGLEQEVAVEPWSIFRGKNIVITSNAAAATTNNTKTTTNTKTGHARNNAGLIRQMPQCSITFYRAVKLRAHRA